MNYSKEEVENKFPRMINIEVNGENYSMEYLIEEDSHSMVLVVPLKDDKLKMLFGDELRGVLTMNDNKLVANPILSDESANGLKMNILKKILTQENIEISN